MLRGTQEWLDGILYGPDLLRTWGALLLLTVGGAAAYGAVFGMWHGARLSLYVAVKFPLVLLLTSALTLPFGWMAAVLFGVRLRFAQAAVLAFLTHAISSVVLASFAPVAWLFTQAAPPPVPTSRLAHNLLYLTHLVFVGGSSLAGTLALRRILEQASPTAAVARRVYLCWLIAYALVGGEVAWALRPFVGSVYRPVVFLREDALAGNVYEFIFTDILPFLIEKGGVR